MTKVNPYLNFNGNCEEAFNFYSSALGKEVRIMRFKDTPPEARQGISDKENDKVMHCEIVLSEGQSVMGSDIPESFGKATIGQNTAISVEVDSENEVNKIFEKLSSGGEVTMKPGKAFWGAYFAMCTDKFGIHWMVGYTYPKQ
ncbi:MAG TPA: VOC family protein [Ignavibacteriaceae bacterium]|nr:VOC family protein [Ignavibacteriaceae bacterium]